MAFFGGTLEVGGVFETFLMAFDLEFLEEACDDLGRPDFVTLTLLELADRETFLELDFLLLSELADDLTCLAIGEFD